SVTFTSTRIQIEGSGAYVATLSNRTLSTVHGAVLQGWVQQGDALRAAGGLALRSCGTAIRDLDPGTCQEQWDLVPSNDPAVIGTGTLVPGEATAIIELRNDTGVLSTFTVPITLFSD